MDIIQTIKTRGGSAVKGKTIWRDCRMLRSHPCFSTAHGFYVTAVHRASKAQQGWVAAITADVTICGAPDKTSHKVA